MKDKRGITTQYCTLFRTEPQSIVSRYQKGGGGNSKQKGISVAQVGNFEYVSEELRLGLFLLEPNIFYKDHKHEAPELYINLTNGTEWRFGNS